MKVDTASLLQDIQLRTLEKAETGSIAERVHAIRVGCKKLKAILRLRGGQRPLRHRIRDIQRMLGLFRDRDVRARLRHRAMPSNRSPEARRALRLAVRQFEELRFKKHKSLKPKPALRKSFQKAEVAAKAADRERNDGCFHELRKEVKNLQYQLQALERRKRVLKRLEKVSDDLGDAHDLAILQRDPERKRSLYNQALRDWKAV